MDILLLILFIVVLSSMRTWAENQAKKAKNLPATVVVDVKPTCPPHKWFYQEVKDTEGNTIKWKLVCELCGPLKPSDGPARLG